MGLSSRREFPEKVDSVMPENSSLEDFLSGITERFKTAQAGHSKKMKGRSLQEIFESSLGAGFGAGITGRGGFIRQNRAGREKITHLMEMLKKSSPKIKQVKRTSPQGNKKLRETVANEEPNLFKPEGEGFIGGFERGGTLDPFIASMLKGRRHQGLPSKLWYQERGIPTEVRRMHETMLKSRSVKIGDIKELPFPVTLRRMMRKDPKTGQPLAGIRVEKLASDADIATVLPFKKSPKGNPRGGK